jgi:hypothetical protein
MIFFIRAGALRASRYTAASQLEKRQNPGMASDSYHESTDASTEIAESGSAETSVASFRTLSEHDRRAIAAIIDAKHRVKLVQEQVREDVKAVAERLGMKSSELNRIVRLAMQERERGNVLVHEKALIEVAEQVVF